MKNKILKMEANLPQNEQDLKKLKAMIEQGEFGELDLGNFVFALPRYLVTYMNSQTRSSIRSATIVTVTNQSRFNNYVTVQFFKGLTGDGGAAVGGCGFNIPPGVTIDFGTRNLPVFITSLNCVSNPELNFDEGRAIVNARFPEIAVSARVVYTSGDKDDSLLAISDSNIVRIEQANIGD